MIYTLQDMYRNVSGILAYDFGCIFVFQVCYFGSMLFGLGFCYSRSHLISSFMLLLGKTSGKRGERDILIRSYVIAHGIYLVYAHLKLSLSM